MTTAVTRVAAVIGCPVEHSLSPVLHNAAFKAAGVDALFVALRVEADRLAAAVAGLAALEFLGASVTVPHKRTVLPLCDEVTGEARAIGAVNCLRFTAAGRVHGHNTDAGGFVDSLREGLSVDPGGARAVLLGSGGAARAVHHGLVTAGARTVEVVARTPARADWVSSQVHPWTADGLERALGACDLLIDCTSTALDEAGEARIPAPIPLDRLADDAVVASLVYHREPALLASARARGLRTLDGAGMLVYQAAAAFELWTGVSAPAAAMWQAIG